MWLQPTREGLQRSRLERLRFRFPQFHCDAILVTHLPNIFYLCGFSGSAGILLVDSGVATLFTDGRYTVQAKEEVTGAGVCITRRPLLIEAARYLAGLKRPSRVAFSPDRVTVLQRHQLARFAGRKVRWVESPGAVESLRAIKDASEIATIREAARLAGVVFQETLSLVKPGVLEQDLGAEIEYRLRRKGAEGVSFETIIASGHHSALPHARASGKPLRKNELVVFDLGAILRAYCSDITRTVFLGPAPARVRNWYRAVLEAQEAAREALRPGIKAGSVDAAARRVLRRYGLERQFTHSTGHGLGLEVHEAPRLARGETTRLEAGNVVTIEPGVYVQGVGGIRIEDDILLTAGGAEDLSQVPRDFLEL